jgi:hypothetical protein
MKRIRQRLGYANVIATLALVFAMSGGALAAKHYLIESTRQINPKVLKKLKGNIGRPGARGQVGAAGAQGAAGAAGAAGPEGARGPSDVYEVQLESPKANPAGSARTLTLASLPAGSYALSASAYLAPQEQNVGHAQCVLHAESDESDAAGEFTNIGKAEEDVTLTTQLTHTFSATGEVTMTCQVNSIQWIMLGQGTRIVAIRVDTRRKTTAAAT